MSIALVFRPIRRRSEAGLIGICASSSAVNLRAELPALDDLARKRWIDPAANTAPWRATALAMDTPSSLAPASTSAIRPAAPARLKTGNLQYRTAAARHHDAPLRIGVDGVDAHVVPVGFEFVGEDAGERRADMLAHLGADDVDGHDAVAVDAVPDSRIEGVAPHHRRSAAQALPPSAKPKDSPAPATPIRKPRRESAGVSPARC